MTIQYMPRGRLPLWLGHFNGTVLPEVWRMCFFTCMMALWLTVIYNPLRKSVREGGKKTFLYYVFHDCDAFFGLCTTFVTFTLSFFNATVFGRWWKLRELCGGVNGKTVDTTLLLSAYIDDDDERNEMIRTLWLAHALHAASVDGRTHPEENLVARLEEQGLVKGAHEREALLQCSSMTSSTPLAIAYGWFTARFRASLEKVDPTLRSGLLMKMQDNVSAMRGSAADVLMYLSTPVPLAYTHLLEVTVTVYVLIAPMGLVPRLLWMAIPGCFIVTLVFYGFMCVGKLMLNPFDTHSQDSFETSDFLRGTRIACLEVAACVARPPETVPLPLVGIIPGRGEVGKTKEPSTPRGTWRPFWQLDSERREPADDAGGANGGGGAAEPSGGLRRRRPPTGPHSPTATSPLLGPALGGAVPPNADLKSASSESLPEVVKLSAVPLGRKRMTSPSPFAGLGAAM